MSQQKDKIYNRCHYGIEKEDILFCLVMAGYLALVLAAIVGWVFNFMALYNGPINGMFVARVVGVFVFPIGSILGYL